MAVETTTTSAWAWRPDIQAVAPQDAIPDALVLQTSLVAGQVEGDEPAVRAQYVDDAGAGFVPEGAVIDEADPDLAEVVVHTGKIAQLLRLSREQYGQENASVLLSESVQRAVVRAVNVAYIAQTPPTSPAVTPPAGIAHVAGNAASPATVATNLDALVDLQAVIAQDFGIPSHILLSPTAWASLRKFKTADTWNSSLLGAGTIDSPPALLGLPVLVDAAVPAGQGIILDKNAIVSAAGTVNVAVSDQVYFNSDSLGVRCTFRFGANVVRPNRVQVFTVTDPDAS